MLFLTPFVAPYTGAWIEIVNLLSLKQHINRRTLHGCVDWNISMLDDILSGEEVAPYTGAWIEIIDRLEQFENWDTVAPYTGAWIEM